ncbi:type II toxin-antitoxin system VapC family toxin [Xylella taiwanensis]|uniref:type II toxin-antitoxin system VapC family toxin n=1 Tax=Xylella taiwanensis TaxID=1444770 RepID=UPI0004AF9F68|nr:type II toxin-antitoxin system VapC family toxin [Xylella taiwanensis]MCD8465695.1 type II toxin-antitoxin system VapC family toxin [Xylella taiwanensis]MCD8471064.1 type II toxin-antitoxin system VapC family toxin [Xylella taiwanensis]UFN04502.1 type II toxin-antitoxin system VapC family toxin [Xylella taiwanensis]UFN10384.1 type II toxin-antitoxin system VapC family toxin [Xylella taiwanensis]UFN19453.1 type II toxin-antitoxin system VapC family toxin [Xylella taiwanensis]
MLDTNIISDMIRNPFGLVACRIEKVDPKEVCTSIVVAAELRYGCAKKGSTKLLAKVKLMLETIPVLPLDIPTDAEYGRIRAELESVGQTIGLNDLLIGTHAYVLGMTLVTDNVKEFKRIRGLKIENWLECASSV